jgi:hypothetical protein
MLCIPHVCARQRAGKRMGLVWDCYQVDMVRHETIGEYFEVVLLPVFPQEQEVKFAIFIIKEYVGSAISSLGDMMRQPCGHCSCYSGHRGDNSRKSL